MSAANRVVALALVLAVWAATALPGGAGHRPPPRAPRAGKQRPRRARQEAKRMDARPTVVLEWSMTRVDGGKRLRIEYALHNHAGQRVYPCDELMTADESGYHRAPEAVVVMNGDRPGLVRLVRGFVASQTPVIVPRYPIARALEPDHTARGVAYTPLPLAAWTNFGKMHALKDAPTAAVLEVQYALPPGEWGYWTLADGTRVTVPQPSVRLHVATTEPKPLPK